MKTKNADKKIENIKRVATQFRYRDDEHRQLISEASKKNGLSINSWIIQATLKQARADLAN